MFYAQIIWLCKKYAILLLRKYYIQKTRFQNSVFINQIKQIKK